MTEGILDSPLHAKDENGLAQVDGLLHDETFDLNGIEYDSISQTISIPVRRQFHGETEHLTENGAVWKTYEKDWMRSRLTIRRVSDWKAEHDQGINSYTFCSWRLSGTDLVIECDEALVLTFKIAGIDIELEDMGFKGKARIRRGPKGMEISESSVYE